MQSRGTFPQLNEGFSRSPVKPASKLPNASRALSQSQTQSSVASPKRRRQLTATAPKISNPFDKLQGLVGKALRGR